MAGAPQCLPVLACFSRGRESKDNALSICVIDGWWFVLFARAKAKIQSLVFAPSFDDLALTIAMLLNVACFFSAVTAHTGH